MALFFILQDLLTNNNLTIKSIIITIVSGLIGAVVAGFLFAGLLRLFANSTLLKVSKIDTDANETVLFQTPANHFKGIEAAGGQLCLTNKRLVFKSNKLNFRNHQLSISLSGIQKVDRYTKLLNKNGLVVTTTTNTNEKFVVENPAEWISELTKNNSLQPSNQ